MSLTSITPVILFGASLQPHKCQDVFSKTIDISLPFFKPSVARNILLHPQIVSLFVIK